MKKIIWVGILALLAAIAVATNYIYNVTDRVNGRNLEVTEFEDDLGLIDDLMYSDMMKTDANQFRGNFEVRIDESNIIEYLANGVQLNGRLVFDDNSKVDYEVTDFKIEEGNIDEYGATEAWGTATLKYEATIKITKEIPVDVAYSFYQDVEDKDSFSQNIDITGENTNIQLQDEGTQRFNHRRRCLIGCE